MAVKLSHRVTMSLWMPWEKSSVNPVLQIDFSCGPRAYRSKSCFCNAEPRGPIWHPYTLCAQTVPKANLGTARQVDSWTLGKRTPAQRVMTVQGHSDVHDGGASVGRNDAAPTGPLVKPCPELSAEEAVRVQLEALSSNDEPRPDHGLEVMYYFANASGTFEGGSLPRYFGFATDLYHFGHFALKFKMKYPALINLQSFEILKCQSVARNSATAQPHGSKTNAQCEGPQQIEILVNVFSKDNTRSCWLVRLSKQPREQGVCWLTDALLPATSY